MECETCKYWKKHPHVSQEWGNCRMLASGDADKVDIFGNENWVKIRIETLPDFFCACYEKGE